MKVKFFLCQSIMRDIRISKLCMSINVGKAGDILIKAARVLFLDLDIEKDKSTKTLIWESKNNGKIFWNSTWRIHIDLLYC